MLSYVVAMKTFIAILILAAGTFIAYSAYAEVAYDHTYSDGDILHSDTGWSGRVLVDGVLFVPAGVTLSISPGTIVEFTKSDAEYRESGVAEAVIPGSGLRVEGKVIANGTPYSWITFTSAEPEPVPGDWGCIFFDHSKGSGFTYSRFEYAAYTIHSHFSRLSVSRSVVTNCEDGSRLGYSRADYMNCDIYGNTGKGLNFSNCRNTVAFCNITGNYEGIFLNQKDDGCVIRDNNIHSNRGMDLRLGEFHETDISLTGNWWGTADAGAIEKKVYDKADDEAVGDAALNPAKSPVVNAGVSGVSIETLWEFETGGFVDSTPAVADGRVYFGSWDKHLYCLDEITGEPVWKYETGDCVDSSPAVNEGRVYFASWDRNVYCLDASDGKLVWSFEMEPSNFDDHRQSSPALLPEEGILYIGGFNGMIYALRMDTGRELWRHKTGGPVRTRPVVVLPETPDGGEGERPSVLAGSEDGFLYRLDIETGETIWSFESGGKVLTSPAIRTASDGGLLVFFGTDNGEFYALDYSTGGKVWEKEVPGRFRYSSPLVFGRLVVAGDCNGILHAFDTVSGDEIWSLGTFDVIYSPPVASKELIITGNNSGKLYFISPDSGKKVAEYSVLGPVQSVFAAENGIFTGSRDNFLRSIRLSR